MSIPSNVADDLYNTYGILIKNDISSGYNDIYTWGNNDYGQLGVGFDGSPTNTPVFAEKLATLLKSTYIRILQVATLGTYGGYMMIEEINTKRRFLYGWGRIIAGYGEPITITSVPLRFNMGNTHIIQVVCSNTSIYILVDHKEGDRHIYSIGSNIYGELGIGSNADVYIPTIIPTLNGHIRQMATGFHHALFVMEVGGNNYLYSCGLNNNGQLGSGTITNENTPRIVNGIQGNILQVACGGSFSMAVIEISPKHCVLYSWGSNDMGQLGIDSNELYKTTPQIVPDLEGNIIQIACSANFSLVLMEAGPNMRYIYYWGFGFYGKMIVLDSTGLAIFTGDIIQIYCDENIGYALLANGRVYCWNFNTYDSQISLFVPLNNPPVAFPDYNIGSLESYFGEDFIYENACAKLIPMCRKMANMALYRPVVTGGNNPKMSSKMKYSQLVRNFR